jgi:plasmid stability protein
VSTYILRKVDDELWRQVKAKAALEGVSVKAAIERLLRAWVAAGHSGDNS